VRRVDPSDARLSLDTPFYEPPASARTLTSLAGGSTCWALYSADSKHLPGVNLSCAWEAIYVWKSWGPDPVGVICSRCGDVRALHV